MSYMIFIQTVLVSTENFSYAGVFSSCYSGVAVPHWRHIALAVIDCGFTLKSRHLGQE